MLPADPAVGWNSPQDLSAMASIAREEQYFYFDCTVVDPVFCQPFLERIYGKVIAFNLLLMEGVMLFKVDTIIMTVNSVLLIRRKVHWHGAGMLQRVR